MAVTFDALGPSSSGQVSTASPTTWAHVNSGNCIVVIANWTSGGSSTITAVSYGGTSLSRIAQVAGGGGTAGGCDVWGVISGSLPTGSNTVSVTGGGPSASNHVCCGSLSFTGAMSFGTAVTNSATAGTLSVTVGSTVSGGIIVGGATFGGSFVSATANSPGTLRFSALGDSNGGADQTFGQTVTSPGGSQAVGFSWSSGSDFIGLVAVEVQGAGAPPPPLGAARPGRTWQRRFRHLQDLPLPPVTAPPAPPAGSQPHGFGSSRRPWQALWGGVAAPFLPSPAGTAPDHLVIARRTAARACWRGTVSSTVNAAPATVPSGAAPDHLVIARRAASRAVAGGRAVPGVLGVPVTDGLVRRRAAARAVWRPTATETTNLPYGNQPDGVVYRRRTARAVVRGGPAPFPPPIGTTPDRLVIARRSAARAVWRGVVPATTNLLNGNQPGSGLVRRRGAARAVWRPTSTRTTNLPYGDQPGGLVRRRQPARAAWAGTVTRTVNAAPSVPAGQQPHGFVSSRRPVGGIAGGAYTPQPNASGPSGTAQPRASVPVPRRASSRVLWRGPAAVTTANAAPAAPSGSVQPRAAVPLPRRHAARAVWGGQSTPQPHVPGSVQPRATIAVPRRVPARALWHAALGTLNASGPSGTVQPRATVPVPRRTAQRALWHAEAGPANAHGGNGQVQPRPVVARRTPARAVWAGTTARTANITPTVSGTAPDHLVIARRSPARAVTAWKPVATVNAIPPASGTIQPRATVPVPRREAQRVIWRGGAVPGQQPEPGTGGLVRRRSTARGLWHGNAGAPPPSAPASPVPGGTVKRRPPARGQWAGTRPATSNAHGPAVSAPKMRPRVTSRAAARGQWRGTVVTTTDSQVITLWTVTGARQLWTADDARQLWTAGIARQLWRPGTARN